MTFDETDFSARKDAALLIADSAAQAAAEVLGAGAPQAWSIGGKGRDGVALFDEGDIEQMRAGAAALAGFVRANPAAPDEALYIFAAGRGIHPNPAGGFAAQPFWLRMAYLMFRETLLAMDRAQDGEALRLAAEPGPAPTPPVAAALLADPADTILEPLPDPLEIRKDAVLAIRETAGETKAGGTLEKPDRRAGKAG